MKTLTLDLYERIIQAVYDKSRSYLKMLGHATKDEVANYIGFYAMHKGLFWSEQDGNICGVSTAHPGKKNIDWTWEPDSGIWTAHLVWADNPKAHADILRDFLASRDQPVRELWTWRNNKAVALTLKKLERILSYGRRVSRHEITISSNSSTTNSKLQRVDEGHPQGSSGDGSRGLQAGSNLSAKVC